MRGALLFVCLLGMACSSSGSSVFLPEVGGTDTPAADGVAEVAPEIPRAEETEAGADLPDLGFDETEALVLCQPGDGCFGDKCTQNEQCASGWCVDQMGEGVCTQLCQDECPDGWSCKQLLGTAPDFVFACVSDYSNLCRPCQDGNDCKSPDGTEDVCLDYEESGSFCGGACGATKECPWGFSCKPALTVDGIATTRCVADTGECPCTAKSVALSLWTPCRQTSAWGTCAGKRVCTADGLLPCDAPLPAEEACNGLDDDCDGETDEATCDDGNACTDDACLGTDGCQHEPLSGGECLDGNPCTIADHCVAGECLGTVVECDDKNPCTDDSCDETGGCVFTANQAGCDDGDPCTVADACTEKSCAGVPVDCECASDSDCLALEDGDLCNGTLECDVGKLPHLCMVDPASVVACAPVAGDAAACANNLCDPASGECVKTAKNEGGACAVENGLCDALGSCCNGACCPQGPPDCSDDNPCTDDACDPQVGCTHAPNALPCSDGNPCTTGDHCADGSCTGGPALACADGNPCTADTCDPQAGCVHTANAEPCDDGNACTGGDHCQQGQCLPAGQTDCNDDNPCTLDGCDAQQGCVYTLSSAACDDGNPCTTGDHCALGACVAGAYATCDDQNPCTDDACDPNGGCKFVPNAKPCDDGNPCTTQDHCQAGACKAGGMLACDDKNPCTDDACDVTTGCVHAPNLAPCNDGDPCTPTDVCAAGTCEGTGQLTCADGNKCTADTCVPLKGCVHAAQEGLQCDDGNPCTTADVCQAGACVGGPAKSCSDGNPCTNDACIPAEGCVHTSNDKAPCDDGDPCTTVDACKNAQCIGAALDPCSDGNVCTDDSCVPLVGCAHVPHDGLACNDGNACTVTDKCLLGSCFGTGTPDCNDGNVCTTDACVPVSGCTHTPALPCCGDGVVTLPEECDDGNTGDGDGCSSTCKKETAVTMAWTDSATGSCNGQIWQTMQQIVAAMPATPLNVTIKAKQVSPTPGYGEWTGTFKNTTCPRQWLQAIANKDVTTYNNWTPAVCKATDVDGNQFFFVCKNDGGGGRQIAIYPVGAQDGQYMKIYMIDRTYPWCDLIGTNARPGFDNVHNNSDTSGVAGDSVSFTWSF